MPRKGKRKTISRGIYADSGGYEVRVVVGGTTYSKRLPKDSTVDELKRERTNLEGQGRTETPRAARNTLRFDARRYIALIKHLESWKDREAHLEAWNARLGDVFRHRITSQDVLAARVAWLAQKKPLSPKTINHRVSTLRNLYRTLDGKKAPTPCDDVTPLEVPKTPIQRIDESLMLAVDAALQERERAGILPDAKTRARYRVLISTGKRPIEVMRAQPSDVNLERRVWVPRDAKGGFTPGVYLNDDQLAAWRLFIDAGAWGAFNHGAFVRSLRSAGWPKTLRLYQARHSTWITASELGIDLHDIAIGAGHTDPRMTRKMYVPVLNSRLQTMSERLNGRFQGFPMVPVPVPARKSQRKQR